MTDKLQKSSGIPQVFEDLDLNGLADYLIKQLRLGEFLATFLELKKVQKVEPETALKIIFSLKTMK